MIFLFRTPKTVKELAKLCVTPRRLCLWIWFRIRYKKDINLYKTPEYWATPQETLHNLAGDCDDIAILCRAVLQELGYTSYLLTIFTAVKGHAVCAYKINDTYYIVSSWGQKQINGELCDIAAQVYKNWKLWRKYDNKNALLEEYVCINSIIQKRLV